MIAAMAEVYYARGTREWPLPARVASVAGAAAAIAGGVRLAVSGDVLALAGGVALGAAGAGGLAWFLRSLRRDVWFALDEKEIRTSEGVALAYAEIDRIETAEGSLVLQAPRHDIRVPTSLVRYALFVATLEDRMGKPRGTIARVAR